jgi:hypothetical protein
LENREVHSRERRPALLPNNSCAFVREYLQELSLTKAVMVADLVLHQQCPCPRRLLEKVHSEGSTVGIPSPMTHAVIPPALRIGALYRRNQRSPLHRGARVRRSFIRCRSSCLLAPFAPPGARTDIRSAKEFVQAACLRDGAKPLCRATVYPGEPFDHTVDR